MVSTDRSQTARIARLRQKIQGTETDSGVKTNADYSHFLQKKLGRTVFFRQTLDGVVTDIPCCEIPNNDLDATAASGIAVDSQNNVLVTGIFGGAATFYNADGSPGPTLNASSSSAFIVKYDSSGTVLWATKIDGPESDIGYGIAVDSENNVLVTGGFGGAATFYNADETSTWPTLNASSISAFIVKYDSSGTVLWATKIDGPESDIGYGIAVDSENNVLVTGGFGGAATFYNADETSTWPTLNATGFSAFIVKYNPSGTVLWATKIDGPSFDEGSSIAVDNENNVLATGSFSETATFYNEDGLSGSTLNATGFSAFIVKYNPSGTVLWATT